MVVDVPLDKGKRLVSETHDWRGETHGSTRV